MKKSINLLPPPEQKKIKLIRMSEEIRDFAIWLTLSLFILGGFLFAAIVFLKEELSSVSEQITSQQEVLGNIQSTQIKGDIDRFNEGLTNFTTIRSESEQWSKALAELASLLARDVTIDGLDITRADKKFEIKGRAGNRNSVLKLRQDLLNSEYFGGVNFPLANLEKARDTDWSYRFYVKTEKLK